MPTWEVGEAGPRMSYCRPIRGQGPVSRSFQHRKILLKYDWSLYSVAPHPAMAPCYPQESAQLGIQQFLDLAQSSLTLELTFEPGRVVSGHLVSLPQCLNPHLGRCMVRKWSNAPFMRFGGLTLGAVVLLPHKGPHPCLCELSQGAARGGAQGVLPGFPGRGRDGRLLPGGGDVWSHDSGSLPPWCL